MIPEQLQAASRQLLMVPRLLWGAFCVSTLLLGFVLYFLEDQGGLMPRDLNLPLLSGLVLIALVDALFCFVLVYMLPPKKHLLQALVEKLQTQSDHPLDQSSFPIRMDEIPVEFLERLGPLTFFPLMLGLVLSESVSVIGFVAAFFHGQAALIGPFVALSLTLNLLMYPRLDRWLGRLQRYGLIKE